MVKQLNRTKSTIYGIKGKNNIFTWKGLAIHLKNRDRVGRCKNYDTCQFDRKSINCLHTIKKQDAMSLLESEFNISTDISEKMIFTLMDYGWLNIILCNIDKEPGSDYYQGNQTILFDSDL
ncbi:hypothetical protein [Methanosalsum natronophilum]|uniref:hypothetical protein n=1 Tax=Methanosalsum natronophilum TaxID=768733 RepID=UPI002168A33D|nr:hypothetical protein [Methanosalsum natronophilum]MCS3923000.1 hypothetical protein [Methanosalsum natronophilum]